MKKEPTPLRDALLAYVREHARPEDAFLTELKEAAREAGIPPIWIAPEQAAFLGVLLGACGAREVVEVGTLAGVSAIAMARALPPGGRVRTIEKDPARAAFARHWVARSDVAERVVVLEGEGTPLLAGMADDSADACFIDADKEGYADYLEAGLRIVRPKGLLLADNAFAFGQLLDPSPSDPGVAHIRRFNELVAARSDLDGVIVPLGDGLWVAVRAG